VYPHDLIVYTLQGTDISHMGERNIIDSKVPLKWDMSNPRRVSIICIPTMSPQNHEKYRLLPPKTIRFLLLVAYLSGWIISQEDQG